MGVYQGYGGYVEVTDRTLVVRKSSSVQALSDPEVIIPLSAVAGVHLRKAGWLTNGHLQVLAVGHPPAKPGGTDAFTVVFTRQQQAVFRSLHDWLCGVAQHNRLHQVIAEPVAQSGPGPSLGAPSQHRADDRDQITEEQQSFHGHGEDQRRQKQVEHQVGQQRGLAEAEAQRQAGDRQRVGQHPVLGSGAAPTGVGVGLPGRAVVQAPVRQAKRRLGRRTGVRRLMLSRKRSAYPAAEQVFTAIDLETTGLDGATDRIVELGMVKFRGDGQVVDEFATLISSPGSSREAQEVHKIRDEDLVGAPSLEQVFPELLAFLDGTIVVAHNLDFEASFLVMASKRHQISLPDLPAICTLQTSRRQLDGHAFSLKAMYKTASGQWAADQHSALGDARSTMQVLLWLMRTAPSPLYVTGDPTSRSAGPQVVVPCPILPRPVPLMKASVAELLASFPQSSTPRAGNPAAIEQYTTLLELSLADGRLTFDEAEALTKQARLTGLTGTQLRGLHHEGWLATFPEDAHLDWATISAVRRREMFLLAEALGLSIVAERLGALIEAAADPPPGPEARYLRGTRFAFTGEGASLVALRERAVGHGASVAVNITKTVQWLVSTTPECDDRKHTKAVELGIPVLTVSEASARLEEAIRSASLEAFERQRQHDEWVARDRQYAAERDAYWRPRWRATELDRDP